MEEKIVSIKLEGELLRNVNIIAGSSFNCNRTATVLALVREAVDARKAQAQVQEEAAAALAKHYNGGN